MGKAKANSRVRAPTLRRGEVNCRGFTEAREELLLVLVVYLKEKTLSVAEAARRLGCSHGVVSRARDGLQGNARRGRTPVLTEEEELAIERKTLFYYSRGVPLTETDVCTAVQFYIKQDVSPQRRKLSRNIFMYGTPGHQWMVGFRRWHPAVAKVTGRPLSGVRAAATSPETMARMMALLKQVRKEKGIKPCNIFNADECGINARELLASRRNRYLAPSGTTSASILVPGFASDAESSTCLPVIAADGTQLPPTLVFKGTPGHVKRRRPKTGDNGAASWQLLTDVPPPGSLTIFKTPPGMDKDKWTQWCIRYAAGVFQRRARASPRCSLSTDAACISLGRPWRPWPRTTWRFSYSPPAEHTPLSSEKWATSSPSSARCATSCPLPRSTWASATTRT